MSLAHLQFLSPPDTASVVAPTIPTLDIALGEQAAVSVRTLGGRFVRTRIIVVVAVIALSSVAAVVTAVSSVVAVGVLVLANLVVAVHVLSSSRIDLRSEIRFVRRWGARAGALALAAVTVGVLGIDDLRATVQLLLAVCAVFLLAVAGQSRFRYARKVLLVGDRRAVGDLISQWQGKRDIDIRGICLASELPPSTDDLIAGFTVHGALATVRDVALEHEVDQVIVAPGPLVSAYDVRRLTWALENTAVDLAVAAEVHGATPRRIAPELIGRRLVLSVGTSRPLRINLAIKGAIDRLVGALLLTLFAVPIAIMAVIVRVDSKGPAFYRQVRTGLGGKSFTMYKLRTMSVDADSRLAELQSQNEGAGLLFKLTHDPRVTGIGRVLRKLSLDELPQLINVIRGDMSLIGPRPGLPTETSEYDDWIRRRLQVRPGMTGLWQVSGRSSLGWNESVRLDLDYVDNLSLVGDLSIAFKTARAVINREGAH